MSLYVGQFSLWSRLRSTFSLFAVGDVMYVRSRTRLRNFRCAALRCAVSRGVDGPDTQSQDDFVFLNGFLSRCLTSPRAPRRPFPVGSVPQSRVKVAALLNLGWHRAATICVGPFYTVDLSSICTWKALENTNKAHHSILGTKRTRLI